MEEKNNYVLGTIGALIGGLLFSIPWILMYVYGNMLLSLLAFVIAFGAFKFYKLFKGKVTKKTPIIITIVSLLAITIATFVIIPILLVNKEGFGFQFEILKTLYANNEFVGALLWDYVMSVLFTILGIGGIIRNIQNEAYQNKGIVSEDIEDIIDLPFAEQAEKLEKVYEKYDAFNKNNMVPTSLIISNLPLRQGGKILKQMRKTGVIVVKFGKTYFDKEAVSNENIARKNRKASQLNTFLVGLLATILVVGSVIACIVISSTSNDNKTEEKLDNLKSYTYKDINIKLPDTFKEQEADGYVYYNNYGSGLVSQVALEQYELYDTIQNEYEYFKTEYIKTLEADIIKEEEYKKEGMLGYKVVLKFHEYPDDYCVIYALFGNNTYLISYYATLEKATDKDIQNFVNKTTEYQKNVTLIKDGVKL